MFGVFPGYGAGKAEAMLPGHIEAVKSSGVPVVWQCDAVHGNGIVASNKLKTRAAKDIWQELVEVWSPDFALKLSSPLIFSRILLWMFCRVLRFGSGRCGCRSF